MKKLLSTILAVVLLVSVMPMGLFNLTASAATSGYYTYTVSNGEATITDVVDTSISGDITIPSTLGGYPVTSIGNYAFNYCTSLTSVTIGNGVTNIGDSAFIRCLALTSVTIGNGVTSIGDIPFDRCPVLTTINVDESNKSYCSLNGVLFNKIVTELIQYPIGKTDTNYTIPNGVTSIGDFAFFYCNGLTSVDIPNSVTCIGNGAFRGCTSFLNIEIPVNVVSIGYEAFRGCTRLTNVTIPDSVTSIGSSAFDGCTGLTSVTIGNGVTSIGNSAFENCTNLTRVNITDMEAWCNISYGNLFSEPLYYAKNLHLNGELVTNLVIPEGVTNIGNSAFKYCTSITSITMPDSVTRVGNSAFEYCTSITSITIPDSVTSIGDRAFYDCTNLENVYITDIATWCGIDFEGYYSNPLCSVDNLYLNGELVKDVVIPQGVTTIPAYAFSCKSLTSMTIPDGVTSIGINAFEGCSELTSVDIPNSVTYIGSGAFSGCTSLKNIEIPVNVTSIGYQTFSYCKSLANITIPNRVTSIDGRAFEGCSGLTSIDIPNSVTSIGDGSFQFCTALTKINIPNSATSIGNMVFYETALYNDESNWLDGVLYIDNCLIKAKTSLSGVYNINEGITVIADDAFSSCTMITSIGIPNSVIRIGGNAFSWCKNITSITIPDSVTSIGEFAFYECKELKYISIPRSVISIGQGAFSNTAYYNSTSNWVDGVLYIDSCLIAAKSSLSGSYAINEETTVIVECAFNNCTRLKSISIPKSVVNIGDYALFYKCANLNAINVDNSNQYFSSIDGVLFNKDATALIQYPIGKTQVDYTIPNGVISISTNSFYNCQRLTSIEVPNSVISISDSAFAWCENLTSITIPNSVKNIAKTAFEWCDNLTIYGFEGSYAQTFANENDITFVAMREDISTDIIVHIPDKVMDSTANLSITAVDPDKVDVNLPEGAEVSSALIYDIYFEKDGEKVQPSGDVTVYIPVPEDMNGENCKVFFIDENGNLTDMNAVYKDGYMVFTTDHFSYYSVIEFAPEGILGDANGDGTVNISDAVVIARASAGLSELNETAAALSDVSGDGNVNVSDAVLIARYGAGLISKFPVEG